MIRFVTRAHRASSHFSQIPRRFAHMATAEMMRAVDIKGGTGPASALFINTIPKPTPQQPSDAIVKIKAFGLNRMDLLQRLGHYPIPPHAPRTLGVEFSGVVESLGEDPEQEFKVGDEVFGLAYGGAYAEYIAVSTHMLIHKPPELSWDQAAGIPEVWITAYQALHTIGGFTRGQTVLWHAGASGVSIAGIQLSLLAGASAVYATAGSDAKATFCTSSLGATACYNYRSTPDWARSIQLATQGRGVDVIVDVVGQSYFAANLDAVANDGRIVHLGSLSGASLPAGTSLAPFIRKRVRFEGSSLRAREVGYQRRLRDGVVKEAVPAMRDGRVKLFTEKVFGWEEVGEAHRLMERNETMGKIICRVE